MLETSRRYLPLKMHHRCQWQNYRQRYRDHCMLIGKDWYHVVHHKWTVSKFVKNLEWATKTTTGPGEGKKWKSYIQKSHNIVPLRRLFCGGRARGDATPSFFFTVTNEFLNLYHTSYRFPPTSYFWKKTKWLVLIFIRKAKKWPTIIFTTAGGFLFSAHFRANLTGFLGFAKGHSPTCKKRCFCAVNSLSIAKSCCESSKNRETE